jgi:sugar lactone lactonase YvrE
VHKRYFVYAIFACLLLSTQLLGQGAPFVLVTDLSGHQILSVNTTLPNPTVTPIFTLANSNFEGIVYGPEGSGLTGNRVYVCDPTGDKIYRLSLTFTSGQPTGATSAVVYAGGSDLHLQCGRFTSTGDFLVTSKTSGGIWRFAGLGSSTLQIPVPIPAVPTQIIPGTDAEGDLTQANNGDLLIVDITTKHVLRSVAPFTSVTVPDLITSNLVQPTGGIARRNDGQIYVADGGGQNNIKVFGADGSFVGVCGGFGDPPQFIKFATDGTLYVATANASGNGPNNGKLYSVNTSSCVTTLVADIGQSGNPPAIGVAIPPTSTSKTKTTVPPLPGFLNFNFGFSQFVASNVTNTCTTTVTESQTHLLDLQSLIPTSFPGAVPVPFLGEAGFGTLFDFPPDGCTHPSGGFFDFAIAGFASGETNPRIVECPSTGPCEVGVNGFYPISEAIPGDCCILKKPGGGSKFFVVNLPFSGGQFCGFQNPSNDSLTNTFNPLDPNVPTATGNTWNIKFKIVKAGKSCNSTKTSDFITDALELLSVIRVRDGQGNVTNDIVTPVSSTSTYVNPCANLQGAPICVETGNKQYSFGLSTSGLQSGVWNFSITSLTNNISVQWNFFKK